MGTLITIILAVCLAGCALWAILRLRKQGGSCTGCAGCPMAGSCTRANKT